MIYKTKPRIFNPRFDVVSCFVEHQGKILLLHRQDHKPEGNTWCLPGGKADKGEELIDAMMREMKEEISIDIPKPIILYLGNVFVKYPTYDFVYHMFKAKIKETSGIKINDSEHKDLRWLSPNDALKMDLIQDVDLCIKMIYNI
jgi:8-oxo-dGTP diphosphatase